MVFISSDSVIDTEREKKKKKPFVSGDSPMGFIGNDKVIGEDSVTRGKDWQDFTKGEAMWYVAQKGLADTYRGGKQLLGVDEEEMAEEQKIINQLMQKHGGLVTGAYFGGMILDPVGWFLPATKARTVAKMAMYGAGMGAAAGAMGYVDPEAKSLTGEGQMSRGEQAALGSVAGGVIAPAMGKALPWFAKKYAPVGDKIWAATTKNPEIGTGIAGGMIGYNMGEDTTVEEDLRNALLGVAAGASIGGLGRYADKATGGKVGRFFIPEHGLDDEYLRMKGMNRKEANVIAKQFNNIVAKMQNEDDQTRELIYKLLTKDESISKSGVDGRILEMTDEAREIMSKYGKDLVGLGVLKEDTWAKNIDKYIHRVYNNPDFHKRKAIFKSVYGADDIRFIGDEIKMRGYAKPILKHEWDVDKLYYLDDPKWDIISAKSSALEGNRKVADQIDETVLGQLRRGELDPDEVIVRRDWTPEERADMGEVTDASVALFRTGQLMSNDVSAHRFFKTVADRYSVKTGEAPDGYELVPNLRTKFGDLANTYIPKNIHHDIVAMDRWRTGGFLNSELGKAYKGVNNWWKLTKTAYNLPVHMNNFGSNVVMYDVNGGSLRGLRQAVKDLTFPKARGASDRLLMAQKYDVFGGNFIGNEVLQKNKSLYRAYDTAADTGSDTVDSILNKTPDLLRKTGRHTKRWTLDKFKELYTWEDNLFRMGLFNTLIAKGMNPIDAARKAREGFVDYSKSSPFLEMARNSALPFAAYAYGIVPRLGEAAAKTPWKFAKWAAIIGGLNAVGEDLSNAPDRIERERKLFGASQGGHIFDLPFMPANMIKLAPQVSPKSPERAGKQDDYYLNIGRMIPGQAFQFSSAGKRIPGMPDVMQPGGMLLSGLADPLRGINTFTGQDIPRGVDRFKEVGRQFIPNLPISGIPGIDTGLAPATYAGTKTSRGLQPGGFVSQTKENQTALTAIMQNLGLRVQAVDPTKLGQSKYFRVKYKWDALQKRVRKLERDFQERVYAGREKVYQKKMRALQVEANKLNETANKLGL
jgi:hypothetical protein